MISRTTGKTITNTLMNLLISTTFLIILAGCSDNSSDTELIGNWIELSDFEGVPRSDAIAFTIGAIAYVGTGYDGSDRLQDFWAYDPVTNNWQRKADFPGIARNGAVAFGTFDKGYVGTGYDGANKLADFWEYNPVSDTWTQIADFAGTARYGAVAFALNNKGYVGTGYDGNTLKDLWEYDPSSGQWTQKTSLGGGKRRDAVAFTIDGKGYVCTGVDNGDYEDDFWEYNPENDTWDKKRAIVNYSDDGYDNDYSSITGINKVAFTVNGKGYVATAGNGTTGTSVWEYNPLTDLWVEKTDLEASARTEAIGFGIGYTGYLLSGRNGSYYFDDLWGFSPDAEQTDEDDYDTIVN